MSVCESFSGLLFLAQIYRHTSTPFAYLFVSIQKPPKGWTASSCQGFVVCGSWYICSCKKKQKTLNTFSQAAYVKLLFVGIGCDFFLCKYWAVERDDCGGKEKAGNLMQLQTLLLTAVTVSNTKEGGKLLFCCGGFFVLIRFTVQCKIYNYICWES